MQKVICHKERELGVSKIGTQFCVRCTAMRLSPLFDRIEGAESILKEMKDLGIPDICGACDEDTWMC